jgi:hypothetical protein
MEMIDMMPMIIPSIVSIVRILLTFRDNKAKLKFSNIIMLWLPSNWGTPQTPSLRGNESRFAYIGFADAPRICASGARPATVKNH